MAGSINSLKRASLGTADSARSASLIFVSVRRDRYGRYRQGISSSILVIL